MQKSSEFYGHDDSSSCRSNTLQVGKEKSLLSATCKPNGLPQATKQSLKQHWKKNSTSSDEVLRRLSLLTIRHPHVIYQHQPIQYVIVVWFDAEFTSIKSAIRFSSNGHTRANGLGFPSMSSIPFWEFEIQKIQLCNRHVYKLYYNHQYLFWMHICCPVINNGVWLARLAQLLDAPTSLLCGTVARSWRSYKL